MATQASASGVEIERAVGGHANAATVNKKITEVWSGLLADPKSKAQVAAMLGCPADALDPDEPPFKAQKGRSGLTGMEILIIAVTAFAAGAAKGAGSKIGKKVGEKIGDDIGKGLVRLWDKLMRGLVSPRGSKTLGAAKKSTTATKPARPKK